MALKTLSPSDIKDLSELLGSANEAGEIKDNNFETLPDGDYIVSVANVDIRTTRTSHKLMISWDLVVDDEEEYAGRHIFKNTVLDKTENMQRALKDIKKANLDTTGMSIEQIIEALPGLEGEIVVAHLVTNKNGDNQWVNILSVEEASAE